MKNEKKLEYMSIDELADMLIEHPEKADEIFLAVTLAEKDIDELYNSVKGNMFPEIMDDFEWAYNNITIKNALESIAEHCGYSSIEDFEYYEEERADRKRYAEEISKFSEMLSDDISYGATPAELREFCELRGYTLEEWYDTDMLKEAYKQHGYEYNPEDDSITKIVKGKKEITFEDLMKAEDELEDIFSKHPEWDDRPDSPIPEWMTPEEFGEIMDGSVSKTQTERRGKMEGKYQESLDLFKKIYFNEDGSLDTQGYDDEFEDEYYQGYVGVGKLSYYDLGMGEENERKIVGRSAFTPEIIRVTKEDNDSKQRNTDARYFLTLDTYGKFNEEVEFAEPSGMRVQMIDVTDMSQEDIMRIVEEMLYMSNKEIMTMFNCYDLYEYYSTEFEDLLIDDVVQECLEQNGQEILGKSYEVRYDCYDDRCIYTIKTKTDKGIIEISNDDDLSDVLFMPKEGEWEHISQFQDSYSNNVVKSELGQLLMKALQENAPRKQLKEILKSRKTKSGITLQEIGEETTESFTKNTSNAIEAMSSLENGVRTEEKEAHAQKEG